jgi:hypothetical protein
MFGSGLYEKKAPKTTITRPSSTAHLLVDSGDRFDPANTAAQNAVQQYNNFIITKNQNLLQGAFNRIQLTDMRFPWAIPNINARNNKIIVLANSTDIINDSVVVEITEGYYTGAELATAVQSQIIADCSGVAAGIVNLLVTYNARGEGEFEFSMTTGTGPFTLEILPYSANAAEAADPGFWVSSNQLMKAMGFDELTGSTDLYTIPIVGGNASLLYTDFVDIVSEQLTNFQKVKDISTNNTVPRQAMIERLYITNETSQNDPANVPGTYPFTIMRQIRTPKSIRWSGEHAIGQIDIKLYDMFGQPLYQPSQQVSLPTARQLASGRFKSKVLKSGATVFEADLPMPNFQLTLLASED